MTATLTVNDASLRADALVCAAMPSLSRSFVQRLFEEGRVTAGGRRMCWTRWSAPAAPPPR